MVYVLVNKMEKIEKTIRYAKLFAIYKSQLSLTQQEIINDYYLLDLSLGEIAENRHISRSAVDDALSKGCNKLDDLENQLMILRKQESLKTSLNNLRQKSLNQKQVDEIEEILKELDYGI